MVLSALLITRPPGGGVAVASGALRPDRRCWSPSCSAPGSTPAVHVVTMAAGLALAEAVDEVAGVRALLKWPNDLIVDGRKLAGLLAEAELSATGEARAVVVGVGCNVEWHDFPPELAETATACNLEAGHPVDRSALLDAFLARFAQRLDQLDDVAADYRARLDTLGRRVQVDLGQRVIQGVAVDIDASGQLIVTRDDGEPETIAVGDVVHLRRVRSATSRTPAGRRLCGSAVKRRRRRSRRSRPEN